MRITRMFLIQVIAAASLMLILLASFRQSTAGAKALDDAWSYAKNALPHGRTQPPGREEAPSIRVGLKYIQGITVPIPPEEDDSGIMRLWCPEINVQRYEHLRGGDGTTLKYFFALNLRQNIELVQRLLSSIIQTIEFLGPENCAFSIVEGNSDDGTLEILAAIVPALNEMGIAYRLQHSTINPTADNEGTELNRIRKLAELRNLAMAPMTNQSTESTSGNYAARTHHAVKKPTADTTVVFVNDVAICPEDLLELVYQRKYQQADMTCAMDWNWHGPELSFYDIWILRTINGDSITKLTSNGPWQETKAKLFETHPESRERYAQMQPVQVFACWNGLVSYTAAPLLGLTKSGGSAKSFWPGSSMEPVRFRQSREGECFSGEPDLFAKDMWYHGFGRIAIVPTVNVGYTNKESTDIKIRMGYVSDALENQADYAPPMEWQDTPPDNVMCINVPDWGDQSWRPWNETLV